MFKDYNKYKNILFDVSTKEQEKKIYAYILKKFLNKKKMIKTQKENMARVDFSCKACKNKRFIIADNEKYPCPICRADDSDFMYHAGVIKNIDFLYDKALNGNRKSFRYLMEYYYDGYIEYLNVKEI